MCSRALRSAAATGSRPSLPMGREGSRLFQRVFSSASGDRVLMAGDGGPAVSRRFLSRESFSGLGFFLIIAGKGHFMKWDPSEAALADRVPRKGTLPQPRPASEDFCPGRPWFQISKWSRNSHHAMRRGPAGASTPAGCTPGALALATKKEEVVYYLVRGPPRREIRGSATPAFSSHCLTC